VAAALLSVAVPLQASSQPAAAADEDLQAARCLGRLEGLAASRSPVPEDDPDGQVPNRAFWRSFDRGSAIGHYGMVVRRFLERSCGDPRTAYARMKEADLGAAHARGRQEVEACGALAPRARWECEGALLCGSKFQVPLPKCPGEEEEEEEK